MSELPDVDYLSATLKLAESGRGEMTELRVTPIFDQPRVEIEIEESPSEDPTLIVLNRRQIECLADFLAAWLNRAPALTSTAGTTGEQASSPSGSDPPAAP